LREHQGERSTGTFGCLVRKAGSYYALTNRHVAGGESEEVRAIVRGETVVVGQTSNTAVDRLLMSAAFPQWAGDRTYLTLDAGLVRINDIRDWTSQVFGIGEVGELFDATEQTVTSDLIGCPVRAFGAVSGVAEGEIRALFFRYQSLGGFDYATDVLIGPRRDPKSAKAHPLTRPGDSGTIWFYDPPSHPTDREAAEDVGERELPAERGLRARRLRPIAMQWGGQRQVMDGDHRVCTGQLRVDDLPKSRRAGPARLEPGARRLLGEARALRDRLEGVRPRVRSSRPVDAAQSSPNWLGDDRLGEGSEFRMGRGEYVPLADVPDYVWLFPRGQEGIQHFADIDIHDIDGGETMLERCRQDANNIAASKWKAYFDGFADAGVGPDVGCLPFRVWQIWKAMVESLENEDVLRFVAAAGVLAHYVGDASQPLHCSYLHHGIPPMKTHEGRQYPVRHESPEFDAFKETDEYRTHALYEQRMFEVDAPALLADVNTRLQEAGPPAPVITTGHEAAAALINMMHGAAERLSPQDIIDADDPELGPKARSERLWANQTIPEATIASLADSVRLLAVLWETAWEQGGGDDLPQSAIREFTEDELEAVYRNENETFVPSLSLDDMAENGDFEPPA
jgi:hypothetical protein